ncbi:hypothetical protein FA13DRAFT_1625903, partial [Coprinellus micaceus]
TNEHSAGQTVVEVIVTDPVLGPSTSIISTITPAGAPVTLTGAPTTPQQGPVGAPASTSHTAGGPTPFTYVTVINGQSRWIADVFQPTRQATTPFTTPTTGSIMDYDAFTSRFGTFDPSSASRVGIPLLASFSVAFIASLCVLRPVL